MLNRLRAWLGRGHVERWNREHPIPLALVGHTHYWDTCRNYGWYRYRVCLNGCGQRQAC